MLILIIVIPVGARHAPTLGSNSYSTPFSPNTMEGNSLGIPSAQFQGSTTGKSCPPSAGARMHEVPESMMKLFNSGAEIVRDPTRVWLPWTAYLTVRGGINQSQFPTAISISIAISKPNVICSYQSRTFDASNVFHTSTGSQFGPSLRSK